MQASSSSAGEEADVSDIEDDDYSPSDGIDAAAAAACGAAVAGGRRTPGRRPPRQQRGTAAGQRPPKRSIRRKQALPVQAHLAPPARQATRVAAAAVAAADRAQADCGEITSDLDAGRLEACRQMYRTLPRQSRYAQHRLRVLGRAIELLAISRALRTEQQQRDLDEMLRGLKL